MRVDLALRMIARTDMGCLEGRGAWKPARFLPICYDTTNSLHDAQHLFTILLSVHEVLESAIEIRTIRLVCFCACFSSVLMAKAHNILRLYPIPCICIYLYPYVWLSRL